MQSTIFDKISPIAFSIYGFDIYWYSLAYICGFLFGLAIVKHINKKEGLMNDDGVDDILIYSVICLVIGARLGFCLFYDFEKTISDPMTILYIRDGGMSFHGGLLGLALAAYLMHRKYKLSILKMGDLMACVAPIGLFLGRIANFINGELYGKVTDLPWGVVFPHVGGLPRHPTQLYEAFWEGIVLLALMLYLRPKLKDQHGRLSGVFLLFYGTVRFIIEIFKDATDGHVWIFTTGQILSVPMILVGLYLYRKKN